MEYIEYAMAVSDEPTRELLIAELEDFPFDGFAEESDMLRGYLPRQTTEKERAQIAQCLDRHGVTYSCTLIPDRDWNADWESHFEPIDIGGVCRIRAPFHAPDPRCRYDIVMMPKMAFGTGHHATTRLMATDLLDRDLARQYGLDMGCGTGVLAMLAVMRGAVHVDAIDNDEWAWRNTMENIATNGLSREITPVLGDARQLDGRRYDFVLANINRNILLRDMAVYAATLRHGGMLTLSGILEADREVICAAAAQNGLRYVLSHTEGGWMAIRFEK